MPCPKASEYTYLTTMLRETRERESKLQAQLQVQTRQNLSDGEALVKATRRIGAVEADLLRARAEIYKVSGRSTWAPAFIITNLHRLHLFAYNTTRWPVWLQKRFC